MVKRTPLKKYGSYEKVRTGVNFYTKQGTKVFVPNRIIKKVKKQ